MSVNKTQYNDPGVRKQVLDIYLSEDKPTVDRTAELAGVTFHTARAIVELLDEETYKREKAIRYSRSKTGSKNPVWRKTGGEHPNYKSQPTEGKNGYMSVPRPDWMTSHRTQKRVPEHQVVACQMVGLTELPNGLHVHHIDEDVTNNDPSNLAIVTNAGHRKLHARSPLRRLTLWEAHQCGILR